MFLHTNLQMCKRLCFYPGPGGKVLQDLPSPGCPTTPCKHASKLWAFRSPDSARTNGIERLKLGVYFTQSIASLSRNPLVNWEFSKNIHGRILLWIKGGGWSFRSGEFRRSYGKASIWSKEIIAYGWRRNRYKWTDMESGDCTVSYALIDMKGDGWLAC